MAWILCSLRIVFRHSVHSLVCSTTCGLIFDICTTAPRHDATSLRRLCLSRKSVNLLRAHILSFAVVPFSLKYGHANLPMVICDSEYKNKYTPTHHTYAVWPPKITCVARFHSFDCSSHNKQYLAYSIAEVFNLPGRGDACHGVVVCISSLMQVTKIKAGLFI